MSTGHAQCSPSGYDRWSVCAGSVALEANEPDSTSKYADEGTAAHFLGSTCLTTKKQPADFLGREIVVNSNGAAFADMIDEGSEFETTGGTPSTFEVNDEMVRAIALYVNSVRDRVEHFRLAGALEVILLVEQRLSIEPITGERNAFGTSDAIIIARFAEYSVIESDDLKYGMGVEVDAKENGQLMIYALAGVLKYNALHEFRDVILRIHQPRLYDEPKEWQLPLAQLYEFGNLVAERAGLALQILKDGPATAMGHLVAGDAQCKFCRAKYKCPEVINMVHKSVFGDFVPVDEPTPEPVTAEIFTGPAVEFEALLPVFMNRVSLIEDWCLSIRAKVEELLLAGKDVTGYKLVQGRKGARSWTDEEMVQTRLLTAGTHPAVFYRPRQLRTPADLEKALAKTAPQAWEALQGLIEQKEGKPSVAPASDKRAAWSPVTTSEFKSFDSEGLA